MRDTLGGGNIAVKHSIYKTRLLRRCLQRSLHIVRGQEHRRFGSTAQRGLADLLSDFLDGRNQLRNFDSNHGAFAGLAANVQMKAGAVEHAEALAHVA
jgi:hypothetical protein